MLEEVDMTAEQTSNAQTNKTQIHLPTLVKWGLWVLYLVAIYLVSYYYDPWFDATLYRHIAFQFPPFIILGFVLGYFVLGKYWTTQSISIHLAILLFFLASVTYWMLPVSIDAAALNPTTDWLLAVTLWLAGLLLGSQLNTMMLELKLAFLFMLGVMLFTSGFVLNKIEMLLCGAYSVVQQKILAKYLMIAGPIIIFGGLSVLAGQGLYSKKKRKESKDEKSLNSI